MRKFSLELPKFRLELNYKLVRRRKPLMAEPVLPTLAVVNKKYRTGTLPGKIARHLSESKHARKILVANMAAFVIVGTLLPGTTQSIQASDMPSQPDNTIIQSVNVPLDTEKTIVYPVPLPVRINQGFSAFHPGLDLSAQIGDPIKPMKAGVVVEAGFEADGYGNTILIDHGQGLTTRYAHLSKIDVSVGQTVTTDAIIGLVGITGHSTGPHLHFEVRQDGVAQNPFNYIPAN